MDDKTKRGCLWAAAGGCLLVLIVGGALIAGGGWLLYQNFSLATEHVEAEDAAAELESVRARFAGQRPLIVVDEDDRARLVPRESPAGGTIEWLHLVAYDPRDGQIARIRMPFWLMRLSSRDGQLAFSHDVGPSVRGVRLSVDDVEAAGPGLLFDDTDTEGKRVLIWAE